LLEDAEKKIILETYEKHRSTYKVAKELGISQSQAFQKIKKYKLNK
jgi:transcriptional regulator with PAS, ATPase and Fis domain